MAGQYISARMPININVPLQTNQRVILRLAALTLSPQHRGVDERLIAGESCLTPKFMKYCLFNMFRSLSKNYPLLS